MPASLTPEQESIGNIEKSAFIGQDKVDLLLLLKATAFLFSASVDITDAAVAATEALSAILI